MTKNLYIINGTMGVGKTTISKALMKKLDSCVFLDGDWCWMMDPFIVNDETKRIVLDNIIYCINNYIHSSTYKNIIFCWVIPSQSILDDLISRLDTKNINIYPISLICNKDVLIERLQNDIQLSIRNKEIIDKSLVYMNVYNDMKTIKIDTSHKDSNCIADEIIQITKR